MKYGTTGTAPSVKKVPANQCVVGEVYHMPHEGPEEARLCVSVFGDKRYMISLKTGRQTNSCKDGYTGYIHMPNASFLGGENNE